MIHKLSDVNNTRNDWKIRVRITRMWPSFSVNQHFLGFNIIFLDAEDFHVLAYAYPVVWNAISNMILEGNAYDIENFVVREPIGFMRPVSSDKVIVLTNLSNVQPVPLEVITIPRHKFELKNVSELRVIAMDYGSNHNPIHASDILGVVIQIEPVKYLNTGVVERTFVRFKLFDGSNSVDVVAWDEHVEPFAPIYQELLPYPVVVLMSTVKPRIFNGSLQISTCDSSQIFVNINYPGVSELRQRIMDEGIGSNDDSP